MGGRRAVARAAGGGQRAQVCRRRTGVPAQRSRTVQEPQGVDDGWLRARNARAPPVTWPDVATDRAGPCDARDHRHDLCRGRILRPGHRPRPGRDVLRLAGDGPQVVRRPRHPGPGGPDPGRDRHAAGHRRPGGRGRLEPGATGSSSRRPYPPQGHGPSVVRGRAGAGRADPRAPHGALPAPRGRGRAPPVRPRHRAPVNSAAAPARRPTGPLPCAAGGPPRPARRSPPSAAAPPRRPSRTAR